MVNSDLSKQMIKRHVSTNVNGQGGRWPRSSTGARISLGLDLSKQVMASGHKCQWPGGQVA